MQKQKALFIVGILALLSLRCGIQRKKVEPYMNKKPDTATTKNQMKQRVTLQIKGIANGHIKSGNYGGSTQFEVFPSVYNYSYFDSDASEKKGEFEQLVNSYMQHTQVNNAHTLREYLAYLYLNNKDKLREIHNNNQDIKPKGNIHQELPILFFIKDEEGSVLQIDPYRVTLSGNEHLNGLNLFLQENAYHFSSEIPDDFYKKHFAR